MNTNSQAEKSQESFLRKFVTEISRIEPWISPAVAGEVVRKLTVRAEQLAYEAPRVATYAELRAAERTLEGKQRVMRAMRVVTAPVAAAFMGLPVSDLHSLHSSTAGKIGGKYLQALCFSVDELRAIAKYPQWFDSLQGDADIEEILIPGDIFLARCIWVGWPVAFACLCQGDIGTLNGVPTRWNARRSNRLSDVYIELNKRLQAEVK